MIYIHTHTHTHMILDTYIVKAYFGFNVCFFSKLVHQDIYVCMNVIF